MKEIKEIKNLKMSVRENTLDEFVIKESDYEKCNFEKDDIWLDAGANIGAFACKYSPLVERVISFEPDISNFQSLVDNLESNNISNCTPQPYCIVANNDKTREFFLNVKKNKGTHSLLVKRGRDKVVVDCVNINKIITKYKINKIKMDVEGAEYELMKSMDYSNIKEIILEYHFVVLKDVEKKEKYYELVDILKNNGFQVNYRKDLKSNWTTIIHAKKI